MHSQVAVPSTDLCLFTDLCASAALCDWQSIHMPICIRLFTFLLSAAARARAMADVSPPDTERVGFAFAGVVAIPVVDQSS